MARYDVTMIGDDFEVAGFEVDDIEIVERLAALDERRRSIRQQERLTYGALAVFVVAMAVAAVLGWADGSFDELAAVLAGGGPWAALVMNRHFKKV